MLRCAQYDLAVGTWAAARALSTGPSHLVDDIVHFVRGEGKGKPEQAEDIIRSGLAQTGGGGGLQEARLQYAASEVHFESGNWEAGLSACLDARKALTPAGGGQGKEGPANEEEAVSWQEADLEAGMAATRALLVLGRDTEAARCAAEVAEAARSSFNMAGQEAHRWRYLTNCTAMQGLAHHAQDQFQAAASSFEAAQALADHADKRRGTKHRDAQISLSLLAAANFRMAVGDIAAAESLAERADVGAVEALESCQGSAQVSKSPSLAAECRAGALLCAAQLRCKASDWDGAEDKLSAAVRAAEEVGGERHPRVALPLLLTGEVFSRTRRVTYAEGLYRECSKLMRLDHAWPPSQRPTFAADGAEEQGGGGSEGGGNGIMPAPLSLSGVHSSVAALLCWRMAQLMVAMPNRTTELHESEGAARHLFAAWQPEGAGEGAIAFELGGMEALRGKQSWGMGCVLDMLSRRALPCD